jgi:Carbohydrate binding module (family 6)/Chitobiase/beta-hexosaminidase C-terminal domain/Fibronectin type III domain
LINGIEITPLLSSTPIPGTIQAEAFDTGGEGIAYHDTDTANSGGAFRTTEGVDIKTTTDTGGGYAVGWMNTGEWLKYTVNVTTAGTYTLTARVATPYAGKSFHIEIDNVNVTGPLTVPVTGAWDTTWATVTKTGFTLTAGQHVMRFVADTDLFDVNHFAWTNATPDITPPTTPGTPTTSNVTSNSLTLNWTASTDNIGVTGYRVERCTGSGCATFSQLAAPTTNSYSDTALSPLTSYTYRVRAADGAGNTSGYSGTVSATTQSLGTLALPAPASTVMVTVSIILPTDGSTTYYTTDGTDPTTSSTVYTAPFTVQTGTTVKARAFKTGYTPSPVANILNSTSLPSSTGLAIGSNIKLTDYLNVRTSASLTAPTLGVQPINATGVIIGGPVTANGHTWWQINYTTGPDGWSVQDWMVKI